MTTVSIKIPDEMKRQVEDKAEEGLYQNDSEYIRTAIREKLEKDNGLTAVEEEKILERIEQVEKDKVDTVPLEEVD